VVSLLGGLIPAPHTIGHRAALPDSSDGPVWAATVAVAGCRHEPSSKQYQTADGRVVVLSGFTIMPSLPEVHPGDRLVIDGDEHTVERVDAPIWLSGQIMHHEVWTT
jgi:hypothetical protein